MMFSAVSGGIDATCLHIVTPKEGNCIWDCDSLQSEEEPVTADHFRTSQRSCRNWVWFGRMFSEMNENPLRLT